MTIVYLIFRKRIASYWFQRSVEAGIEVDVGVRGAGPPAGTGTEPRWHGMLIWMGSKSAGPRRRSRQGQQRPAARPRSRTKQIGGSARGYLADLASLAARLWSN